MKIYQLFLFSCLIVCLATSCTNAQMADADKAKLESAFKAKYPNVKKVKWNKDSNGNQEAEFELNDEKYRADFTPTGNWIETENSIKYKHLPKAVQDAIEREYDKDDIEEIEQVNHYQKGIFYDVEFDPKGEKKFDIEYNALGKIIGRE